MVVRLGVAHEERARARQERRQADRHDWDGEGRGELAGTQHLGRGGDEGGRLDQDREGGQGGGQGKGHKGWVAALPGGEGRRPLRTGQLGRSGSDWGRFGNDWEQSGWVVGGGDGGAISRPKACGTPPRLQAPAKNRPELEWIMMIMTKLLLHDFG